MADAGIADAGSESRQQQGEEPAHGQPPQLLPHAGRRSGADTAGDDHGLRELSLFTGAGGGLLGSLILGWHPVQFVEHEFYCQRVIAARFPGVPIHDDVRTFFPVPGSCDIVTGGFPCQPHSQAGKRLGGLDDRDLWPDTVRVLRESGAPLGFFENVPGLLTSRDADGLPMFGRILGDLSAAGFDAEWCVLGADDVGAPHRRKRLWILAVRHGYDAGMHARAVGAAESRSGRDAPLDLLAGCGEVPDAGAVGVVSDAEGFAVRTGLRADEPQGEWRRRPSHVHSPWHVDPADVPDSERRRCGRQIREVQVDGPAVQAERPACDAAESIGEDVGHADEPGPQGLRDMRERAGERAAWPPSLGGQAVGDPGSGLCAGRSPVPGRGPEGRAAAGRSGEGESGLGYSSLGGQPMCRPPSQPRDERHALCPDGDGYAGDPWLAEPYVGRVAHGVASRVDRLRALGNGQVPQSMAAAFTYLAREAGLLGEDA